MGLAFGKSGCHEITSSQDIEIFLASDSFSKQEARGLSLFRMARRRWLEIHRGTILEFEGS